LHLWSLSVEEQFYFIWPLLLILLQRFKVNFLKPIIVFIGISFIINLYLTYKHPTAAFFLPVGRFWEIGMGAFIGILSSKDMVPGAVKKTLPTLSGIALIALISFLFIRVDWKFPGWMSLVPVVSTGLIILSGSNAFVNRRVLSIQALVGVGLISYPLYLWHWPCFAFERIFGISHHYELQEKLLKSLILLVCFAAAFGTYSLIEKPIRQSNKSDFAQKRIIKALILSSAGLVIICIATLLSDGFPQRLTDEQKNSLATAQYFYDSIYSDKSKECRRKYGKGIQFCYIFDASREPTAILLGDSLANQYFPSLAEYLARKYKDNLLILANDATPALIKTVTKSDRRSNKTGFDLIEKTHSIERVFLINAMYEDNQIAGENGSSVTLVASLKETLDVLKEKGKKVFFFYPNPYLNFEPVNCLQRPFGMLRYAEKCEVSLSQVRQSQLQYREKVDSVLSRYPQVFRFDPVQYLCSEKDNSCKGREGSTLFYAHDRYHLGEGGQRWISQFYSF